MNRMVQAFGYSLDLLTLIQGVTTAVIVGVYAALTSLGEQRANHQSNCQMCLLVSFVVDEHPGIEGLADVVGLDHQQIADTDDDLSYFDTYFTRFRASGELPSLRVMPTTNVFEQFGFMLLSPFFAPWFAIELRKEIRRNTHRIRNTEIRKNYFSKLVLAAIGGGGFLATGAAFFPGVFAYLLIFLGLLAILGSIGGVLLLSFEQQSWKTYWSDRLTEILAAQDREKAHDEFNRTLLQSNFVNEQPDVPFPGRLGLYTGVYSVVQGLILLTNSRLGGA